MEWQPIETAPKDGIDILTYFRVDYPDGGWWDCIAIAYYWEDPTDPEINCWYSRDVSNNMDVDQNQPTHWMPLPEPPAKEGEA